MAYCNRLGHPKTEGESTEDNMATGQTGLLRLVNRWRQLRHHNVQLLKYGWHGRWRVVDAPFLSFCGKVICRLLACCTLAHNRNGRDQNWSNLGVRRLQTSVAKGLRFPLMAPLGRSSLPAVIGILSAGATAAAAIVVVMKRRRDAADSGSGDRQALKPGEHPGAKKHKKLFIIHFNDVWVPRRGGDGPQGWTSEQCAH